MKLTLLLPDLIEADFLDNFSRDLDLAHRVYSGRIIRRILRAYCFEEALFFIFHSSCAQKRRRSWRRTLTWVQYKTTASSLKRERETYTRSISCLCAIHHASHVKAHPIQHQATPCPCLRPCLCNELYINSSRRRRAGLCYMWENRVEGKIDACCLLIKVLKIDVMFCSLGGRLRDLSAEVFPNVAKSSFP
jgi:hypothetical protein